MAGGERLGVIGNTARNGLKRMPSGVYWAALGAWRIRTGIFRLKGTSGANYDYRRLSAAPRRRMTLKPASCFPGRGWTPTCLAAGRVAEGRRLRVDRQGGAVPLRTHRRFDPRIDAVMADPQCARPGNSPDYVWDIDNLNNAPGNLRDSSTTRGASTRRSTARCWSTTCCWPARAARRHGR